MIDLWGTFDSQFYLTAVNLFTRLLGVIFFFAFAPFIFQMKGLLGKNGILPIGEYLSFISSRYGKKGYYYIPTLFWLNSSNSMLLAVVISGTILSVLLAFNVYPLLLLPLLYILYLSIISAGQDFLGFGWESFLMEITCNAFFLNLVSPPNPLVWVSLNLLLFRFHFQAGISKFLSRDENWRAMSALQYHYMTQPLPNTQAWFLHRFPLWFHRVSCALMFFIELVVPLAIFWSEDFRFIAWIFLASLQVIIWFSGNLSYLNHMTFAFCTILISDSYFQKIIGSTINTPASSNPIMETIAWVVGGALIVLQGISLWNYFMPHARFGRILESLQPFHLINRYGIFAVMTTKRYEIVVEGSEDGNEWREYIFRYKPSELSHRPRRISPYQPRLDWQAWFLPFTSYEYCWWFQSFLARLLDNSADVVGLMRINPFPEKPPKYVRALIYDYDFTDWATLKKEGTWWKRNYVGAYSPILMKKSY